MSNANKFDQLMLDVTGGGLEGQWDQIMGKIEEVLKEEKMGTLNEMIYDISRYLEAKGKLTAYLDKDGVFKAPVEMIFSWFSKAVENHRVSQ